MLLKKFVLYSIHFYQRYVSFDTGIMAPSLHRLMGSTTGTVCRFIPRCSDYTYEAVDRYGILYGLYVGLRRILRCHPFGGSGYDPVPKKSQSPNHNTQQG